MENQRTLALKCGIPTRVFWNTYPFEVLELGEVRQAQQREEWERAAWMVSRILAAWVSEPPTPAQLLGDEVVERIV